MNKNITKLNLSRETITTLVTVAATKKAQGAGVFCPTDSVITTNANAFAAFLEPKLPPFKGE